MTFESKIVVEALLGLEQQLASLRRHADELAAAFGNGRFGPAVAATQNLRQGFDNLAVTITRIKAHIVAFDGEPVGATVESLGELALRAGTIVIAVQLSQLTGAIHRAPERPSTRGLFAGRFRSIDDVVGFLGEELHRINGIWMPFRNDERAATPSDEAPAHEQRRVRYRRAVREAQQAVGMLGRDPDVAHFLREGMARPDWPEVHMACTEIAAIVNLKLDAEPDRRLFDAQPAPIRSHGGASTREL